MRTMKELCQEALDVQDACNLSGVVHSFSRTISDLRTLLEKEEGFSTDKLNRHPVCVLFIDKMASLCGCWGRDWDANSYPTSYDFCKTEAAKAEVKDECPVCGEDRNHPSQRGNHNCSR